MTKPIIGYRNIAREANSYIGSNAQLAFNGLTYDGWVAPSPGVHEFGFNFSQTGQPADYLAVAGHNLSRQTVTVKADGSTVSQFFVINSSPFLIRFNLRVASTWTLEVQNFDEAPRVNVCNVGLLLELQRGFWVGHSPMKHNRSNRYLNNLSDTGQLLGRKLIREGANGSIVADNVSSVWVRGEWNPFSVDAEKYGFFLQHNPFEYPEEVSYCWSTGNSTVSQDAVGGDNNAGRNTVSMNVRGIV